jgi:SAM-dependent methyltransferase
METVACNGCGGIKYNILFELSDYLLDRPAVRAQFVRCRQCGLVYQNPRPTPDEISQHYPPDYEVFQYKNKTSVQRFIATYGIQKRCRAITRLKKEGHLLDVGCATGSFLANMRHLPGWHVQGVEISDYAANVARQNFGLEVYVGALEQAAFPSESFDVVTLWDVLEHLHDPSASLAEIWRILRPGGIVAIRVPNLDSWDARLFGRYWAGWDAPRHLYVFSLSTIRAMLERHKFFLQGIDSNIGAYPIFLLSLRFWLVAKRLPASLRRGILGVLSNPFARLVSAPLFYFYGLGKHGPDMVLIATRIEESR